MRLVIPVRLVMGNMAIGQGLVVLLLDMSGGCVHDTSEIPSIALVPGEENGRAESRERGMKES